MNDPLKYSLGLNCDIDPFKVQKISVQQLSILVQMKLTTFMCYLLLNVLFLLLELLYLVLDSANNKLIKNAHLSPEKLDGELQKINIKHIRHQAEYQT